MENKFTIEEVQNFWNKVANIYDSSNKQFKETHFQRFSEAIKYMDLKSGMKVLNIWSRTGEAVPYIRKKCPNTVLFNLELSPKFIEVASQKFPNEKFEETNLAKLRFENNYFDYILSLETLEHTPNPLKFLKECYRVLKSNGFLIMSLPPATAEIPLRIYELFSPNHGEGPHKFLSSREVKKLFKQANFKLISHKGTLLIPVGPRFLKKIGEKIINKFQNTFLSELGIRQFYVCQK